MNIGCPVSKKNLNRLATARLDREPEVQSQADWLVRAARQLRAALSLQIPVGFQDDTGFYCGDPQAQGTHVTRSEPGENFRNTQPF